MFKLVASLILVAVPFSLYAQNPSPFSFDTSASKAIGNTTTTVNAPGSACFQEMRSTVVNRGVTNATCHVVYIPLISGELRQRNALQVDATASHVRNASGQPSGKLNASATLQTCRVISTGSACWAASLVSQDTTGAIGVLNGIEMDVNVQNPIERYTGAASNPVGIRSVVIGPHNGAIGTAFMAQKLGPGTSAARWSTAFLSTDSGASTGLSLGSVGSSARQGGQPIVLHYRDEENVDRTGQINVDAAGNLLLRSGNGGRGTETMNLNSFQVLNGRFQDAAVALPCGSSAEVSIDADSGDYFTCNITANIAVTIQPPTHNPSGSAHSQLITIAVRNSSGGPLSKAPSFGKGPGGFKVSPVSNPPDQTQVLYMFRWDPVQAYWYEVGTHQSVGL
jgi:hypothetical protein